MSDMENKPKGIRGVREQSFELSEAVRQEIQKHIDEVKRIMTNENLAVIMLFDGNTLKNP